MTDQMPSESAAAWLADKVENGGSAAKLLDVRQRDDGAWDVVLLLDGGYTDHDDAEASMRIEAETLAHAYIADVNAGLIQPAAEQHLAQLGIKLTGNRTRDH